MSSIECILPNVDRAVGALDVITEVIRTTRSHLRMEIGYLSEFVGNELVFRAVDAPGLEHLAVRRRHAVTIRDVLQSHPLR